MSRVAEARLDAPTPLVYRLSLAGLVLLGGASAWAAVSAPNVSQAIVFGSGAGIVLVFCALGGYVFLRHSALLLEGGDLVARTPFSVRRIPIAEIGSIQLRNRLTRGGVDYRELRVVDRTGRSLASILADEYSRKAIERFAQAAGVKAELDGRD